MTDETTSQGRGATRRDVLGFAGAVAVAGAIPIPVRPARATPDEMQTAIAKVVGDATINTGKVKVDIPPLVENGNTIPCTVSVDSPMTKADYVKAIHVFTERNPQPNVIDIHLGPRAGRAEVATRIRLADTQ